MISIEKLKARLPSLRSQTTGISAEDVASIQFNDEYFREIVDAITSPNEKEQRIGYFFAEHLAPEILSQPQKAALVTAAIATLKREEWGLREAAAALLVKFGSGLCDLRQLMVPLLEDKTGAVRKIALRSFPIYAARDDLALLLDFENDDYTSEVGMGGHLIYELRNLALETIESMTGRQFKKIQRQDSPLNKKVALWWDWDPYHKWRKSYWRSFLSS
jgi:HEAT repeat protein